VKSKQQIIFWSIVFILLTTLFKGTLNGWIIALYFVSFLFPVIIGTSVVFNSVLIPKYWMEGMQGQFVLYFIYLLIISIYLEMLVTLGAFVILADYQIANLGKIASDIRLMTVILYLVVFAYGIVILFQRIKERDLHIASLEEERSRNAQSYLVIREDRKQVRLSMDEVDYIESLSDYVKIHSTGRISITKERISALEDQLPSHFLRIHRSYLINRNKVQSFSKEMVTIGEKELPIGRKYKSAVSEALQA
jgi:two-component system response regulator LytT